ncbi:hypothetical protein KIL84_006775 [Mauremys mutica]|uniref:Uncharacterized protein n=1 Tax=Mauremys mutica TaxID=74926 RepID=A0A9D3X003_9SAUR|nr:hypothetical protein KIL84_006775 [Mauremys mutica]
MMQSLESVLIGFDMKQAIATEVCFEAHLNPSASYTTEEPPFSGTKLRQAQSFPLRLNESHSLPGKINSLPLHCKLIPLSLCPEELESIETSIVGKTITHFLLVA